HEPAEEAAEGEMLLRSQRLVAEEEDEMLDEGAPDLCGRRIRRRGRQIDPGNLGAERAGDGPHGERLIVHGHASCADSLRLPRILAEAPGARTLPIANG